MKTDYPQMLTLDILHVCNVMLLFQATIGGKFAPLIGLSDAASEILGKERRRKKPWVTKDVLDICDERRD